MTSNGIYEKLLTFKALLYSKIFKEFVLIIISFKFEYFINFSH
jgi:hypothetical protein